MRDANNCGAQVVAVMRKLLHAIWGVLKHDENFDGDKSFQDRERKRLTEKRVSIEGDSIGQGMLRGALREYVAHHHLERNHQGPGNVLLRLAQLSVVEIGLSVAARDSVAS
jgi:hypothetical protein